MIAYTIEAKIENGKIDYKHSVNFDLEKAGELDLGKLHREYDDFADRMDPSCLERDIKRMLERFIERGIEKTLTFQILKNNDDYIPTLTGMSPFLGR